MKMPFVRRATADALRTQLARAEQDTAARTTELAAERAQVTDLKAELENAQLVAAGAKTAYDVVKTRAERAEEQISSLEKKLRTQQPAPDTTASEHQMTDKQYGLMVLTRVLPMAAEAIEQNDGTLPDHYWKGLSIYVTNAPNFGITDDEIEDLRVAYGIPLAVFQKAKNLAQTA